MEKKIKSAYEIAMEKLAEKGTEVNEASLGDEQKARITRIRAEYTAKRAERQIMFRSNLSKLLQSGPPNEMILKKSEMEASYRRELELLDREMERKIKEVRDA